MTSNRSKGGTGSQFLVEVTKHILAFLAAIYVL